MLIRNDGQELSMVLRGVEFVGNDIGGMEPRDKAERPELDAFVLNRYPHEAAELCACTIEYVAPVPVAERGNMMAGWLTIRAELGRPVGTGRLDHETLRLALTIGNETYQGSGMSGWFEDELLEIQAALPKGVYLKACINCAFSDYSVYGHGLFGDMLCFRGCKSEYLAVRTKADYLRMKAGPAQVVQETYLCPEFERRRPGTGYRG
ncbi:MAG: hypothetical protein JO250_06270 [Armatimonadetes bacterium]|nr:hypothetical protein [Armatimonadota bacterium]